MRLSVFLLLCKRYTVIQPRNLGSVRYSCDGLTRSFHCTSFISATDDERASEGSKQHHLTQSPEVTAVASSKSTYSALMDSAKTKSQLSNREQFNLVLNEFLSREKYRRGHVTFINMALERMEEFELQKDLVSYNRLLDVFPKGRYRPKRLLDAIWPRHLPQTELALELLTVMEDNYVWPNATTHSILEEVFGKRSLPVEKCERMVYWYERYKDADPYWISGEVPEDGAELSRIALQRIVNEGGNIIEHESMLAVEDSSDFILSGHTAAQLKMLEQLPAPCPLLYVEGPHRIWINKSPVKYFSLRLSVNESRHITADSGEGAVVAVCMCKPPTQTSLQQWIKELQLTYTHLDDATIVYNITESSSSSALLDSERTKVAGALESQR